MYSKRVTGTVQDDVPPIARNIGQSPLHGMNGFARVVRFAKTENPHKQLCGKERSLSRTSTLILVLCALAVAAARTSNTCLRIQLLFLSPNRVSAVWYS